MLETIVVYAVMAGVTVFMAGVLVTLSVGLWSAAADRMGAPTIAEQRPSWGSGARPLTS